MTDKTLDQTIEEQQKLPSISRKSKRFVNRKIGKKTYAERIRKKLRY